MLRAILKFVTASVGMGIGVYILYTYWYDPGIESLTGLLFGVSGTILSGMIIYFLIAHLLDCQESSFVLDLFKGFGSTHLSKDK